MRSSFRSGRSAAFVSAVLLCSCSVGYEGPPGAVDADGCPVVSYRGVQSLTELPAGTFDDVAAYADQLSTFTVVGERGSAREGGDPRVPLVSRWVTLRVGETGWRGGRASDPASEYRLDTGDEVETLTWPLDDADRCVGSTPDGNPTLQVGRRYVGALYHARDEWVLFPGAAGVLDDDGALAVRAEMLDGLIGPPEYAARLAAADVPPELTDLMLLGPTDRHRALIGESEPAGPTTP